MPLKAALNQFAAHLRDPERAPPPAGIEDRRLAIYRELIFNNVESFLSSGFPVLRSLYDEASWHALVRDFMRVHRAHTPYFLEIGQEFLSYLQQRDSTAGDIAITEKPVKAPAGDPPFLLELAHYEWVELALDTSPEDFPEAIQRDEADLIAHRPVVSPLVWKLCYQYPVHRIGPDYQPTEPPDTPTFLMVYRDRQDRVRFMESNAATVRLLTLLESEDITSGRQALERLATEMQAPDPQSVVAFGADLLNELREKEIICGYR